MKKRTRVIASILAVCAVLCCCKGFAKMYPSGVTQKNTIRRRVFFVIYNFISDVILHPR